MALYDWKAFFRWLDEASTDELVQRRDALRDLLQHLSEKAVLAATRRLIRFLEEELVNRELHP